MTFTTKKRGADNYLTDQNWDAEDNADEEAGSFKVADDAVLVNRNFKKAHRRTGKVGDADVKEESKQKNPFTAFSGFGSSQSLSGFASNSKSESKSTSSSTIFQTSSTDSINSSLKPEANFNSKANTELSSFWSKTDADKSFFASRNTINTESSIPNQSLVLSEKKDLVSANTKPIDSEINNNNDTYFQHLCTLNVSVLSWIKRHVDNNPCIDLTPVFNDYSKHLKELDEKYGENKSIQKTLSVHTEAKASILKTPENCHVSSATSKENIISSTPIQKEGAPSVTKFSSNFFSSTPFLAKSTETADVNKNDDDDESEILPEPEIKTIVEENVFHQLRCKLFFKKSNQWQELGKGMLYLKRSSEGAKTQLLIRMEIATGKILLNVSLDSDIPMSRTGKNNVMIVSIPNPPVYTKAADGDNSVPCTYLIRVNGAPEADELLAKMKE